MCANIGKMSSLVFSTCISVISSSKTVCYGNAQQAAQVFSVEGPQHQALSVV